MSGVAPIFGFSLPWAGLGASAPLSGDNGTGDTTSTQGRKKPFSLWRRRHSESRRDPYAHLNEIDSDDSWGQMVDASAQSAWNTVVYQKWGLLGFMISGIFSVGRYALREPYIGNTIPKLDQLFKIKTTDGKEIDLRREMVKRHSGEILQAFRPLIAQKRLVEERKSEWAHLNPDNEEHEREIHKRKVAIAEEVNNFSEEQFLEEEERFTYDFGRQGKSLEDAIYELLIEEWSSREFIGVKRAKEQGYLDEKFDFLGMMKMGIGETAPGGVLVPPTFFNFMDKTVEEFQEQGLLRKRDLATLKRSLHLGKTYRTSGMVLEAGLNLGEVFLFNLSPLAALTSALGPMMTNGMYLYSQQSPKFITKRRERDIENMVGWQKAISSGVKRVGDGNWFGLAEVIGFSRVRKWARDTVEDHTPWVAKIMKFFGAKNIEYDDREPGKKFFEHKYKIRNLTTKDRLIRATAKWPIKVAGDVFVLGTGIFGLTMGKLAYKKYFGDEKLQKELDEYELNLNTALQNIYAVL